MYRPGIEKLNRRKRGLPYAYANDARFRLTPKIWKSWLLPGGLLLALTVAVVNSFLLERVAPSTGFYYFAVFTAGFFLAWRFNSSRVLFSLLLLLSAHRAVE